MDKDLETNDITYVWLEISQEKGNYFLIENMHRPADSKIEHNDRFEDFIDNASKEEIINNFTW